MDEAEDHSGANQLQDYLASTRMCDHDHPWLLELASDLANSAANPTEKAIRVFRYVRDQVRFSLAHSRSRATQTLRRGYGECLSKTNAQVALLRAIGIPARFRMVKAESVVLHHLVADFVYKQMPPTASHFWTECFLDDRWVSCEAMLDQPLYQGMLVKGLITKQQVPTIDWDGKSDLIILEPWITEALGSIASPEDAIAYLKTSDEGMPPLWIEKIIAPIFYPWNLRYSDRVRRLARSR
ncbi:MAG: transglutaminase-like domain-containing protein [Anaerolineales bacterium]|jgi:transglutaminase-like putative cysteine protease